jgi:hypothetical protein
MVQVPLSSAARSRMEARPTPHRQGGWVMPQPSSVTPRYRAWSLKASRMMQLLAAAWRSTLSSASSAIR